VSFTYHQRSLRDLNRKLKVTTQVDWFTVHGSWFKIFIFPEIINEPTNGSPASAEFAWIAGRHPRLPPACRMAGRFEFVGRYVPFIQGNIELALGFRARALGISQETKLSNREPLNREH